MIRLLFVGDGERDAATNPHLVKRIVGVDVEAQAVPWARLNEAGHGYDRKLLFAIRQARAEGLQGIVATIDQDKSPGRDRFHDLVAGRTRDREKAAPLPTALGCADPHAEAWLLDDPVAVRTVLQLANDAHIPNVRHVDSPKNEIAALHSSSPRSDEPVRAILVEIAQALEVARCQHADETGFHRFVEDVHDEIGPLAE
jgi:hypothetical protein